MSDIERRIFEPESPPVWYIEVANALHDFDSSYMLATDSDDYIEQGLFHSGTIGVFEVDVSLGKWDSRNSIVEVARHRADEGYKVFSVSIDNIKDISVVKSPGKNMKSSFPTFVNRNGTYITIGENGQFKMKSGNYDNDKPLPESTEILNVSDVDVSDTWVERFSKVFPYAEKNPQEFMKGMRITRLTSCETSLDGKVVTFDMEEYYIESSNSSSFSLIYQVDQGPDDIEIVNVNDIFSISTSQDNDLYVYSLNPHTHKMNLLVITQAGEYMMLADEDFSPPPVYLNNF